MNRSMVQLLAAANAAKGSVAFAGADEKNRLLASMAKSLRDGAPAILEANREDLVAVRDTMGAVMQDRLRLTEDRIEGMAAGIESVAALPDPIGRVLRTVRRPNGLLIQKVSVPMGVIGIIYESRPNVTSDAAALCLKAGSACILRGGKEALRSNGAIADALRAGILAAGFDPDILCFVTDPSHDEAARLMTARGQVDLLIPRGGAGLIRSCLAQATVPCIETGTGICHIYVDKAADVDMAVRILVNAKTSRPSVCNAAEDCLVHREIAEKFLPAAAKALAEKGVELRLDPLAAAIIPGTPAGEHDFDTEFLDYILGVRIVSDLDEAIRQIALHSTHHSDAIVTQDEAAAEKFLKRVDSAAVYVNASTRFTDGGEFGLGCEIGISTSKVGARGPMGLEDITSTKYLIRGSGQIR